MYKIIFISFILNLSIVLFIDLQNLYMLVDFSYILEIMSIFVSHSIVGHGCNINSTS